MKNPSPEQSGEKVWPEVESRVRGSEIWRNVGKRALILTAGVNAVLFVGNSIAAARNLPNPSVERVLLQAVDDTNLLYETLAPGECPPVPADEDLASMAELTGDALVSEESIPTIAPAKTSSEVVTVLSKDEMRPWNTELFSVTTIEELDSIVNDYTTSEFNFPFVAAQHEADPPEEFIDYRHKLHIFMNTMAVIPKELYDAVDINGIIINSREESKAYKAQYDLRYRTLAFSPEYIDDPYVFMHEFLGHAVHRESCGSVHFEDSAVESFNESGYEYTEDKWHQTTEDTSHNVSPYATRTLKEDVAESISLYMLGRAEVSVGAPSTPVDYKILTHLDRIEKLTPGSVERLISQRDVLQSLEGLRIPTQ